MIRDLSHLLSTQHGLVLRRQLLDVGGPADSIDRMVSSGELIAVRRGVYTTPDRWDEDDPDTSNVQVLLRIRAASMLVHQPHVISHRSAAALLGMPTLWHPQDLVHLTRFGVHGGRTRHGVKHHKAPFEPWQIESDLDLPCFGLARTAADVAREEGLRAGLVAFDAALRRGASKRDLEETVAAMRSWPGVMTVREALDLADPRAESAGESLARLMLLEMGIGQVEPQFGLRRDGREAWADLRIRRHLLEFDGLVKYVPVELGGLARSEIAEIVRDEKEREGFLRSFRMGVSRLEWEDVLPRSWRSTQARLRREILHTDALYGVDLSDLAPYRLDWWQHRRR